MTYCSHPDNLCLNVYLVTFDYSIFEANISKPKNGFQILNPGRHLKGIE